MRTKIHKTGVRRFGAKLPFKFYKRRMVDQQKEVSGESLDKLFLTYGSLDRLLRSTKTQVRESRRELDIICSSMDNW